MKYAWVDKHEGQFTMSRMCRLLGVSRTGFHQWRVRDPSARYRVTTDSEHTKPIAPNVLERRFYGWKPNQAWVADITYIATAEGWLYLAGVIDLPSRKVVGWAMSNRINAELVNGALTMAF